MPGSLQPLCKQSLAVGQCMHPAWKVAGTHPLSDLSSLDSRPVALRQFHWSRKKVKSKGSPSSVPSCGASHTERAQSGYIYNLMPTPHARSDLSLFYPTIPKLLMGVLTIVRKAMHAASYLFRGSLLRLCCVGRNLGLSLARCR